jgi:hypothetical protein
MPSPLDTVADYVADARTLLQDLIPPYRYDDPSLVTALNLTLLEARRLRADLFVYRHDRQGHHMDMPNYGAVNAETVHLETSFRLPVVYGLVGHALARDQDDYQDTRATTFLQMFQSALVGSPTTPPQITGGGR